MRDFLVSGTMPFILVMSVYFLVRFVMYLLPSKSKGTFLFKAQWHFKKPWLIVPTCCFGCRLYRFWPLV